MASIDHTIILFKNGKLLEESPDSKIQIDNLEISFGRDLNLLTIKLGDKNIDYQNYRDRIFYHYEERHIFYKIPFKIKKILKKVIPKKKVSDTDVDMCVIDNTTIINYHTACYNALFIFCKDNTYIGLGGYGHYSNPFTHFYHRGYGRMFEKKMGLECYMWLYEDVLDNALSIRYSYPQKDQMVDEFQEIGKYKTYFEMTEYERKHFHV